MISTKQDLEAEIILYSINESNSFFFSYLRNEINVEKMKGFLKPKYGGIDFEEDFNIVVSKLMEEKILVEDSSLFFGMPSLWTSSHFSLYGYREYKLRDIPEKLYLNQDKLKAKISGGSISSTVEKVYIEKENKAKKEIAEKLKNLKNMISQKKTETELHNYIKENELIPAPFIQHEFKSIVQNRQDFLIKNEFGEFEIWELKSPNVKLFEGEISEDVVEKYKKLKLISKSSELVKAIEQLSVYKKEFIDGNVTHPNFNDSLKENIYNAKLMLVIGSNDELISEIYLEKLNLERYMLNNLNIITWDMFYDKIESYYKQLIDN
jgi:hypothetical protein